MHNRPCLKFIEMDCDHEMASCVCGYRVYETFDFIFDSVMEPFSFEICSPLFGKIMLSFCLTVPLTSLVGHTHICMCFVDLWHIFDMPIYCLNNNSYCYNCLAIIHVCHTIIFSKFSGDRINIIIKKIKCYCRLFSCKRNITHRVCPYILYELHVYCV